MEETLSTEEGVEHVITQEDLEVNPELKGEVEVGETVVLSEAEQVSHSETTEVSQETIQIGTDVVQESHEVGSLESTVSEATLGQANVEASLEDQPKLPENVKEFSENGKQWRKTVVDGKTVSCVEIDQYGVKVK